MDGWTPCEQDLYLRECSREGKPFIYHTVTIYSSVTRLTNYQLNRKLNDYFHCFVSFLHFYVLNTFWERPETLPSLPDIRHNISGERNILIWFCAEELVLSKSLSLVNPDGKGGNILGQCGFSPFWNGIDLWVVGSFVWHNFADGQWVNDLKANLNKKVQPL